MFGNNGRVFFSVIAIFIILLKPTRSHASPIQLSIGQESLKISLSESGLYTINYSDLLSAGVTMSQFNPQQLTLMHRGQAVAFQFNGDSDTEFEEGESILFYGWPFDGSRYEKQFVRDNVFWLFAGNNSLAVESVANAPLGQPPAITATTEQLLFAPENDFFSGWTDQWHMFGSEPDAWYWDRLPQAGAGADGLQKTYALDIPDPAATGTTVQLTTEWMSRARAGAPGNIENTVSVRLNDSTTSEWVWNGRKSQTLTQTIPTTVLQPDNNALHITITTPDVLYLNEAVLEYSRQLKLGAEPLVFTNDSAGDLLIDVGETAVSTLTLWNITNKYAPQQLILTNSHQTNSGLRLGQSENNSTTYLLSHQSAYKTPHQLEVYTATDLAPANQKGAWLAITHPAFTAQARRLATYRAQTDGLSSHVVTIDPIFNQFGDGFPLPMAINRYLKTAQSTWQEPPEYVLLFGDATINPRQLDCQFSCTNSAWDANEPTFIPTDLLFIDRFQGLIPTDQTLGMLDDDLIPDVMIGRIAAQTVAEATSAVSKTMGYETAVSPQTHHSKRLLFLADNTDSAGNFCQQNKATASRLSTHQQIDSYCLPTDPTPNDVNAIHQALFQQINGDGAYVLNYRGHGSVQYWGGGGEILMSVSESHSTIGAWLNHFPTVIISADCLDGHFAWPGLPSISETLLTLPNSGTAAHWSSSGLGADNEHTIMHQGFYDAFLKGNATTIGEAIQYAKIRYNQSGAHTSPLYSFTLQGDPALKFDWVRYSTLFLPTVTK